MPTVPPQVRYLRETLADPSQDDKEHERGKLD